MPVSMLVNGILTECLDARDRGLQYGDGLFETLAVSEGRIDLWQEHLARLDRGCARLGLSMPDAGLLQDEIGRVLRGQGREVVKLIVTRGVGGRGYRPPTGAPSTRIVSRHAWPDYPRAYVEEGIAATRCRTALAPNPALAGIKHLNRLEQVLARAEWQDQYQEGVMCDTRENVVSGTMSNLFLVTGAGLVTPDLVDCGIRGTMRERVIAVARELGIAVRKCAVTRDDLDRAEGLFFTNSLIGLWPVRRLNELNYEIPEISRQLADRLDADET